jgi:cystathionine beta-synthase
VTTNINDNIDEALGDSVLESIGNTPLQRLEKSAQHVPAEVYAKLDYFNPAGSSKDRIALEMIEAAEREGKLLPGGTIVEPTSGNTGAGIAMIAAQKGYSTIFVVTNKVGKEKVDTLRAYGAEVVICDVAVEPEHPESYYSVAARLTQETPNSFRPDQYSNPNNPLAHEKTTGPEIWKQTKGTITHFVAGMGTGGTITGVARFLKSQNPAIKIIGVDPENSVYSGGSGRPYLVEGVGEDFWPTTYDPSVVDQIIPISDSDAFQWARSIATEEGLLFGGSGAMTVAGLDRIEPRLTKDDVVVVFIPDHGSKYLSTIFNDQWMMNYGFLTSPKSAVSDVLNAKNASLSALDDESIIYINPDATVRDAISLMKKFAISQVPVAKNKPPFAAAEIVGSVDELALSNLVYHAPAALNSSIASVMQEPLPTIGIGDRLEHISEKLQTHNAVLVLSGGLPHGVITRTDMLNFLSDNSQHKG